MENCLKKLNILNLHLRFSGCGRGECCSRPAEGSTCEAEAGIVSHEEEARAKKRRPSCGGAAQRPSNLTLAWKATNNSHYGSRAGIVLHGELGR